MTSYIQISFYWSCFFFGSSIIYARTFIQGGIALVKLNEWNFQPRGGGIIFRGGCFPGKNISYGGFSGGKNFPQRRRRFSGINYEAKI